MFPQIDKTSNLLKLDCSRKQKNFKDNFNLCLTSSRCNYRLEFPLTWSIQQAVNLVHSLIVLEYFWRQYIVTKYPYNLLNVKFLSKYWIVSKSVCILITQEFQDHIDLVLNKNLSSNIYIRDKQITQYAIQLECLNYEVVLPKPQVLLSLVSILSFIFSS